MSDVLELLKNVTSNVKVTWDVGGVWPKIEFSGKEILDIHRKSIWLTNIIGEGSLERRILWEDFKHEFKFVPFEKRGEACKAALMEASSSLSELKDKNPAATKAEFDIYNLLVSIKSKIDVSSRDIVPSMEDFNAIILNTGGGADERIDQEEYLDYLLGVVKGVRIDAYPAWISLIDLLPDGQTKSDAKNKIISGCSHIGLDTSTVAPNWKVERL